MRNCVRLNAFLSIIATLLIANAVASAERFYADAPQLSLSVQDNAFVAAAPALNLSIQDNRFVMRAAELSLSINDNAFITTAPALSLRIQDNSFVMRAPKLSLNINDNAFVTTAPALSLSIQDNSFVIRALELSLNINDNAFITTAPALSLSIQDSKFVMTAPELSLDIKENRFELAAPSLTLDIKNMAFSSLAPELTLNFEANAPVSNDETTGTSKGNIAAHQWHDKFPYAASRRGRMCPELYQCRTKTEVRDAIGETQRRVPPNGKGFCDAVDEYLGAYDACADEEFKKAMNYNFGGLYGFINMIDCPALTAYQKDLEQAFDSGLETYQEEQHIIKTFEKNMMLLLTGEHEKACKILTEELGL